MYKKLIVGPTGSGKSFFAWQDLERARAEGKKVLYITNQFGLEYYKDAIKRNDLQADRVPDRIDDLELRNNTAYSWACLLSSTTTEELLEKIENQHGNDSDVLVIIDDGIVTHSISSFENFCHRVRILERLRCGVIVTAMLEESDYTTLDKVRKNFADWKIIKTASLLPEQKISHVCIHPGRPCEKLTFGEDFRYTISYRLQNGMVGATNITKFLEVADVTNNWRKRHHIPMKKRLSRIFKKHNNGIVFGSRWW